jgi:hypothetical protein
MDAGGDYVMIVKANQPQLRADMELIFAEPPVGDHQETADSIDSGHGRIEPGSFNSRLVRGGGGMISP